MIDCHLHCWTPGDGFPVRIRQRFPRLDRAFGLADAAPLCRDAGVSGVVLVSSAQDADETERLFAEARRGALPVAGIVGFLDPATDDVEARLDRWMSNALFAGLRLPLPVMPPGWLDAPDTQILLDRLMRRDLIVEILARPGHLPEVFDTLRRRPALRAIIDHAANPPVASGVLFPWAGWMERLARETSAVCKVCDFHEAGEAGLADEAILPFLGHLLNVFGPGRLIAGSNWPVASLHGGYGDSFLRLQRLMRRLDLDAAGRAAILGTTARTLFPAAGAVARL
ncbi:amidohydrolase family protein [Chelatococcus asaccharovorans]|uniref:L-fuconolactonase n=1 Tax=Chelatococcus asaccharovorans TaxID=28210 RepID=A0A2V3UEP4_9HYPH|nr:amidohydrolase family protein [Chelatococcus asaccharovorans]MBS7707166.1 amidohydrolase family protein [Chelatococcus asaccharovorans]PXW63348.1 L-fuconolactonase [Chelatococcus asaccharovorans]